MYSHFALPPRAFDDENGNDNAIDSAELFRKELYKAVYQYFKGEQDLFSVATLNRLAEGFVPRTLSESLDLFSYHLLTKQMDANEKNTLKLSISHIICFSGPTASVYKLYFDKQSQDIRSLVEQAKADSSHFSAVNGLSDKAKEIAQNISMSNQDESALRLEISRKKTKLFEAGHHPEEMQVLDVIESLILMMKRKNERHNSELAFYRITATLLEIILNDTSLQLIDGENCSQATKYEQRNIQIALKDEDEKKRAIGRKIDLIVSGKGCELSSSEWKRDETTGTIVGHQHVKNIRTNVSMLKKMLSICGDDAQLCVVGMEWLGFVGCAYSVEKHGDIFVMVDAGVLIIPNSLTTLSLIVDTLDLLYKIKHHHQKLAAIVEPEIEKTKVKRQLNKLRPATDMEPEDSNPIFFTPTNKRQKK